MLREAEETKKGVPRGRPPMRTREQVIETAAALVESEGFDALSMPRLARALEIGTMTLYGYVADKDDLLDAVVERLLDGWPEPSADDRPWDERVVEYLVAVRRFLLRRPQVARIGLQRPLLTRAHPHRLSEELAILRSQGFGPAEAVELYRALNAHLFGTVLVQLNRGELSAAARRKNARRLLQPGPDRPALEAALVVDDEAAYVAAVRLILAGAAASRQGR